MKYTISGLYKATYRTFLDICGPHWIIKWLPGLLPRCGASLDLLDDPIGKVAVIFFCRPLLVTHRCNDPGRRPGSPPHCLRPRGRCRIAGPSRPVQLCAAIDGGPDTPNGVLRALLFRLAWRLSPETEVAFPISGHGVTQTNR